MCTNTGLGVHKYRFRISQIQVSYWGLTWGTAGRLFPRGRGSGGGELIVGSPLVVETIALMDKSLCRESDATTNYLTYL